MQTPWRCSVHEPPGKMACLFQVATRHETLAADKQSLAPSTFLLATVEISGVKHAVGSLCELFHR
jgi:hypothetical protein